MHIHITKSTALLVCSPPSPIWLSLLLCLQDSACVQLWFYGGWVNQWNNSVTSGYCQSRVWNRSAAKVTPPYILNLFWQVLFRLLWCIWAMHISITKSTALLVCSLPSPIWFSLRLYMQDSACVQLWFYGGWVNQWNNSVTSENCQIRVWNRSAAKVTPSSILNLCLISFTLMHLGHAY